MIAGNQNGMEHSSKSYLILLNGGSQLMPFIGSECTIVPANSMPGSESKIYQILLFINFRFLSQ